MIIVLGSSRSPGHTTSVIQQIMRDDVHEIIDLRCKQIAPYAYDGAYPTGDAFLDVIAAVQEHDTILFATPVYWYAMSGVLKNFFDRLSDLITFYKPVGRSLAGKTAYVLATGTEPELPEGFEIPFKRTMNYFNINYGGTAYYCMNDTEDKQKQTVCIARNFIGL